MNSKYSSISHVCLALAILCFAGGCEIFESTEPDGEASTGVPKAHGILPQKPDILGDAESIGEKATGMLERQEPRSNLHMVRQPPLEIYKQQFEIQDAGDVELLTYRVRNMDPVVLKTVLEDQLSGGLIDKISAIPETNELVIRILKPVPVPAAPIPEPAPLPPQDTDPPVDSIEPAAESPPTAPADALLAGGGGVVAAEPAAVVEPAPAPAPAEPPGPEPLTSLEVRKRVQDIIVALDRRPPQVMIEVEIVRIFADYTYDVRAILNAQTTEGTTLSPSLNVDLPGAHLRSPLRSSIGAQYGILADLGKTAIEAALDTLESQGFAEGLARPTLVVTNGKKARVELNKRIPIPREVVIQNNIVKTTEFEDIPSFLEIVPNVRDDGVIHLNVKSGFSSLEPSGPVQIPIINNRTTEIEGVHLKQGQTLAIAGFLDEETVAVERKVPILGDIPLIGILFTGTDQEKRKDMILFMVTPYYLSVEQPDAQ